MRRWISLLLIIAFALIALPAYADEPAAVDADSEPSTPKLDIYASMFDRMVTEPHFPGSINHVEVAAALDLAGANRAELERALAANPTGSLRYSCIAFLIVNLPLSDLAAITADYLAETVELAIQARAELPFPLYYSDEQWLFFVLPHRVSQEPIENWRPVMHDALAPLIADCATPEEAWDVVFKWCGEQAGFKQTQRRDQGPLTTIKGGCGRCEELMTLQICALRSVGLPARGVAVPWWSHCDNNHAWTEVLHPDGHWGLPGKSWEADRARQASVVVSRCYGVPGEMAYRYSSRDMGGELLSNSVQPGARWSQYNSIANYREPARLKLDVSGVLVPEFDEVSGKPVIDGRYLYVYVYNYGALRPVARIELGYVVHENIFSRGVSASLGAGTYALTCDAPGVDGVRLVTLTGTDTLDVRWEDLPLLGEETLLSFPKSEAPADGTE